jgi:hypothetical protein
MVELWVSAEGKDTEGHFPRDKTQAFPERRKVFNLFLQVLLTSS